MNRRKYWWIGILALVGMLVLSNQALAAYEVWVTAGNSMTTARSEAHVGVIGKKLYVAGGTTDGANTGISDKLEVYNTTTGAWAAKYSMTAAKYGGAAGVIKNRLYVAGGKDGDGNATATVHYYNPTTNRWTAATSMPAATASSAAAVIGNKLYVLTTNAGNKRWYIYDADTNTWSTKDPATAKTYTSGVTVSALAGKLYIAGEGANNDEIHIYDPTNDTWDTSNDTMATGRTGHAAVVIQGKIYGMGGADTGATRLQSLECYTAARDAWGKKASMETAARNNLGAAVIDGKIYAVGGATAGGATGALEVYTPALVSINISAPTASSKVGDGGTGWAVQLRLLYYLPYSDITTVVTPSITTTLAADQKGQNTNLPGLVVVLVTNNNDAVPMDNLAKRFNIIAVNNIGNKLTEVLATWYIAAFDQTAGGFGTDTDAVLYAAVLDGLTDAPSQVADSNSDGVIDGTDLEALGLASDVVQKSFYINP